MLDTTMSFGTRLGCLLCLLVSVHGFGEFRDRIPNGYNVPHPCKANSVWNGVGHKKQEGSGSRNVFGEDFKQAGKTWTLDLCEKDSDGDGLSNGKELGDPNCTWSVGDNAPTNVKISHPGVCEPWTDPKCQGQLSWLTDVCKHDKFECEALNETGIRNTTLLFPNTPVPAVETTYICMEFDLDTSDDFHLVATQNIVNNSNVMHHSLLFGCKSTNHSIRSHPHKCGMLASPECDQILSAWTLGLSGRCMDNNVGFRIGANGFKRVALQFHWNNPTLKQDYTDQSGMILYYTNNLRTNDAGTFVIGADVLEIPGRTASTIQTSVCPGECTSRFIKEKVYIVSAINHMHYLGVSQKIELFRNGSKIREITNDAQYNYDNPKIYNFENKIEVLPGDTFSTTCAYNSQSRDEVTYFGEATSDEMCLGLLTYYPIDNIQLSYCTSWNSLPNCAMWNGKSYQGCGLDDFHKQGGFGLTQAEKIGQACYFGCFTECLLEIKILQAHACLQGDFYQYIRAMWSRSQQGRDFFKMIDRCLTVDIPCNVTDFNSLTGFGGLQSAKISTACHPDCSSNCLKEIKVFYDHDCMQGDFKNNTRKMWSTKDDGKRFFELLDKCDDVDIRSKSRDNQICLYVLLACFITCISIIKF